MEAIEVWRGPAAADADGNDVHGTPVLHSNFQALVADIHFGESVDVGRAPVLISCTLYVKGQGPTGILASDLVKVRGQKLPVDGPPAVWNRQAGPHRGDVITLKRGDG